MGMDRKKKGKKGGRKILRLPNGKKTLQREDSLASNDQDVNLLDKYDQDQQILRDVNQENEDMDRKKKGKKGGRKILRLPNGKKTLQREEREARQRRDVNQENEDMDRKKKGKKGGRKILRLPNG